MGDSKSDNTKMLYCNSCGNHRNHELIHENQNPVLENIDGVQREKVIIWKLLKCRGCDNVMAERTIQYCSSSRTDIQCFPNPSLRKIPYWLNCLDNDKNELLREIYDALNMRNRRIATMGTRALIDMVILEKVGDAGNFEDKLNKMVEKGHLLASKKDIIYSALNLGNAASHRGFKPAEETFFNALEIVEHMLKDFYYLPIAANDINKMVPKRSI